LLEDRSELIALASPEGKLRYVNHAYASFPLILKSTGRRTNQAGFRWRSKSMLDIGRAADCVSP
jgi:hypothetical protein